jgi:hypothetical protein
MLVVTAGNNKYDYKKTILHCEKACKRFGYNMHVYDLGGLGFGEPFDDPRCTSRFRMVVSAAKPELIQGAMTHAAPGEMVAWIDGDATLIAPLDELEADWSFDVGVTVRSKRVNKKTHYINAGVIFVRNTPAGRGFIQQWKDMMPHIADVNPEKKPRGISDQTILEEKVLLPNLDVIPWDAFNTVHTVLGARVKILECEVYNNFGVVDQHTWRAPGRAKVLHFKGHTTKHLDAYAKEFL